MHEDVLQGAGRPRRKIVMTLVPGSMNLDRFFESSERSRRLLQCFAQTVSIAISLNRVTPFTTQISFFYRLFGIEILKSKYNKTQGRLKIALFDW